MPVIISPLAEEDLREAAHWYDSRQPALGTAFLSSIRATLESIEQMPERYAVVFRTLRQAVVRRFPYTIVYRMDLEQITVVAVYHAHRDPREWERRS